MEGLEGFEGGQTAGLNALKNRWLGRVAARVGLERVAARVAVERPAGGFGGFGGFEGGQTAGLNDLKNRWVGRVAARAAVERHAGGFGACSCESFRGKACGRVMEGLESLEGLTGKQQA